MKDILEEIVSYKRQEVERFKEQLSPRQLYARVEGIIDFGKALPSMKEALLKNRPGIIAEFKRKSPSKGWIQEEGQADVIPLSYQQNGAAALSILTDEHFFGGDDEFIKTARSSGVSLPILYKNFVIDEYQLYQARQVGASAVLLIAAALSLKKCSYLIHKAQKLGMEVLLEIHSESELDYVDLLPDMCGVNNRNLGTFVTEVANSFRLASRLPASMAKVSESGISNPAVVRELMEAGYHGFLIGEHFMRDENPGNALSRFLQEV